MELDDIQAIQFFTLVCNINATSKRSSLLQKYNNTIVKCSTVIGQLYLHAYLKKNNAKMKIPIAFNPTKGDFSGLACYFCFDDK